MLAPTGTPCQLFITDLLYLHWLPPATDQQHGLIVDYNVSCVSVEEGYDPFNATLHDNANAWRILVSELGFHPGNNESINVAMPTFTPLKLLSCRVASINKNGQGPYKYYIANVNPSGNYNAIHWLFYDKNLQEFILMLKLKNSRQLSLLLTILLPSAGNHSQMLTLLS